MVANTQRRTGALVLAMLTLGVLHGTAAQILDGPPHPELGQRSDPADVDWANPIYQTAFDNTDELKHWQLEGGQRMSVENGKFILENASRENHLVCWLKQEVPADFLLEFKVRPQNRKEGLNIAFFSARGLNGESIFDPKLKPRSGAYPQYNRSDLNAYHVSYWKGSDNTPNLRKSAGFHLVAQGTNLVKEAAVEAFQTIRVYKRGGKIRLMVDDVVGLAWDDDGKSFGPVLGSGWIALRQMGHTVRCEYDDLKIFPLVANAPAAGSGPAVAGAITLPAPRPPAVVRFKENPIIRHEMLPGPAGTNICYPSLIRVPSWLPNPLGKYYLYFADHKGAYIRLAYANLVEGPWMIYEPGTMKLEQMVAVARANARGKESEVEGKHVASPDMHVDDEKREIRMYFHFSITPRDTWGHRSGVAVSPDGIRFRPINTKPIGQPYIRVFRRDGYYYALDRVGGLTRSRDGVTNFETGNTDFAVAVGHKVRGSGQPAVGTRNALARAKGEEDVLPGEMRHNAVKIDGNVLTVFFSRGGDLPEHIMCAQASLTGDWKTWRLSPPVTVLLPEMDYEGVNLPLGTPTNQGMQKMPRSLFRELRDPCIFRDDGKTYLLYSVAGEGGIAGAVLRD
ncbi:MAG: DUF1961 family protein [Opitutus sp.]|nr:DUF1961 family protein [Opitutus sp.]